MRDEELGSKLKREKETLLIEMKIRFCPWPRQQKKWRQMKIRFLLTE